jgi:hypothetical protein
VVPVTRQALNELQSLEIDLDAAAFESKDENSQRLLKGIEELHTWVERNREFVPNYGERMVKKLDQNGGSKWSMLQLQKSTI